MKMKLIILTLTLIAALAAGCAQTGGAVNESGNCPEAAPGTILLENKALGYCFLHPDSYTVVQADSADILVVDSVMNHAEPRLQIQVEDAAGRTATAVADALNAELPAGVITERSTLLLGDVEAVVLDQVPGQEMNRLVFVVQDGRLYQFMFTHAAPDLGETYTQMENLYTVVTNSFRFLSRQ